MENGTNELNSIMQLKLGLFPQERGMKNMYLDISYREMKLIIYKIIDVR